MELEPNTKSTRVAVHFTAPVLRSHTSYLFSPTLVFAHAIGIFRQPLFF